jgi:hypothetical protein
VNGDVEVATLAAALRADAGDLALYAGFLLNSLGDALPAELVTVDRTRTLADRVRGGEGTVTGVHVRLGEELFSLRRDRVGAAGTATVSHEVGGIRLSTETLGLDTWSTRVSAALLVRARTSAAAAAALTGMLAPRPLD